jgi:hypothetical protein
MNTFEIECVLKRLLLYKNVNFCGVFAADEVPKKFSKYPLCFVINTDPANKPGEHWVACFAVSSSSLEFFDSFGLPTSAYPHIRGLPYVRTFNEISLQPFFSRTCGHFCIFYISQRASGVPKHQIISRLSSLNPSQRDAVVYKHLLMITKTLKVSRPCISDCRGLQCCTPRSDNMQ